VRSNTYIKRPEGSAEAAKKEKVKEYENDQHQYEYGLQHGGV
jgi:hypothetical protein